MLLSDNILAARSEVEEAVMEYGETMTRLRGVGVSSLASNRAWHKVRAAVGALIEVVEQESRPVSSDGVTPGFSEIGEAQDELDDQYGRGIE